MAAIRLSTLTGSGAVAPAASILLNVNQTSASSTQTVAIPAGTYTVVSDFPMQLTINSVNYFIQGGGVTNPTTITTTASATSVVCTNLSIALQLSVKNLPSTAINAIAWNGTVFVALLTASSSTCYSSPDGITWTARTLPSANAWSAIAVNGAGLFCIVGSTSGTSAATSPDGITWTARTLPSTGTWISIAWNGTVFLAIPSNAANTAAATSPDGITWTARTLPSSAAWSWVAWNGTIFVATSTTTSWGTSPDGITWTARTGPGSVGAGIFQVIAGGGTFVAVLSNTIYSSTDGITWTTRTIPTPTTYPYAAPNALYYPFYVNGQFVIGAAYTTTAPNQYYLLISPDGINWSVKQVNLNITSLAQLGTAASSTTLVITASSGTTYLYGLLTANPFGIYAPPTVTI